MLPLYRSRSNGENITFAHGRTGDYHRYNIRIIIDVSSAVFLMMAIIGRAASRRGKPNNNRRQQTSANRPDKRTGGTGWRRCARAIISADPTNARARANKHALIAVRRDHLRRDTYN